MSSGRTQSAGRVPVEFLHEGDYVSVIEDGPVGRVVDPNRYGWTIVRYPKGTIPYRRGDRELWKRDQSESAAGL